MTANFAIFSALLTAALMIFHMWRYLPDRRDVWLGFGAYILILLVTGIIGASEILANFSSLPPRFLFLIAGILLTSAAIGFSPWGSRVIRFVPLRVLIGLQGFRILPEILLDLAYREGFAPIQMTWHGRNLDILSAVSALLLAAFWNRLPQVRRWAWVQTLLAMGLLVNIVTVAMLSAPVPFRVFMNEPVNTFVAYFPYIWLPGVHVLTAMTLHILTFRSLLRSDSRPREAPGPTWR